MRARWRGSSCSLPCSRRHHFRARTRAETDQPVRGDRGGASFGLRATPGRRSFPIARAAREPVRLGARQAADLQRTLAMSVKGLKTDNPDGRRADACRALVPLRHPARGGPRARQDHHLLLCRRQRGDGQARGDHLVHRRGAPGADRCRARQRCCCSGSTLSGLQINAWSNQLESVSYAMIALVGLYLLTTQLFGSGAIGAARLRRTIAERMSSKATTADGQHDHHHDHAPSARSRP